MGIYLCVTKLFTVTADNRVVFMLEATCNGLHMINISKNGNEIAMGGTLE